jgi:hypothetical protein
MKYPILSLFLLFLSIAAGAQPADLLTLNPRPKSAFARSGSFTLDAGTVIVTPDAPDPVTQRSALFLQKGLREKLGLTLPIVTASNFSGGAALLLGEAISSPQLATRLQPVTPPGETLPDSGGYLLDISPSIVLVVGADPDGTFNGVTTFLQLVPSGVAPSSIQCAHIRDYPDYPIRWVFSQHNLLVNASLAALRSIEDTMASCKLNGLQQNDFKYNILQLMWKDYFDHVDSLREDSRARNIDIVPGVAGIGYSSGILYNDPNLAEGLPAFATYIMESDTGRLIPDPRVSLPNGSFESVDANNRFTGWSFYDDPDKSIVPDRSIYHGGSTSARCTNFAGTNSPFNRKVDCNPYSYYVMSAWLRTESFRADMVQLLAIGQDDNGNSRTLTSTSYSIPATTAGWMKVEVVFNSVGFNHLQLYAGCWGGRAGTIWWDDFQVREAGLTNILRRAGTPLRIRNRRSGVLYREGVDFAPVVDSLLVKGHGTYGPYHQPPTLRRIASGTIANGDTLLVSWFHPIAAVSDAQGNGSTMVCVSEDTLYSILGDQIRRVDSLYTPGDFFLGHDEIRAMNWDSACQRRDMTPAMLLADNLNRCDSIIDAIHPGARHLVWSDMFDSLHNAHNNYYMVNGDLSGDWDLIPRSNVIVNWNGGGNRDRSLKFFADHGFRQVSSPYYDVRNTNNMRAWRLSQEKVQGVLGMMYTTWSGDYSFLKPFAYYAWGAGPYIVHAPLDSNVIASMKQGDSILIEATILPDPYDPADSIGSAMAQIVGYGPTPLQEGVQLLRVSSDRFIGYAHAISATLPFSYSITATNAQGLTRTTPSYRYAGKSSSSVATGPVMSRHSLFIYPNPMNSSTTVSFPVPHAGTWKLRLVDMLGREVYTAAGEVALPSERRVTIDGGALPAGTYRCEVVTVDGSAAEMLVIAR